MTQFIETLLYLIKMCISHLCLHTVQLCQLPTDNTYQILFLNHKILTHSPLF